jgi:hypothetical protein
LFAGTVFDIRKDSGDWVFVDVGFSRTQKSCGLLVNNDDPLALKFSALNDALNSLSEISEIPLNLVLEAPLSVAFCFDGNPVGRSMEKVGKSHRYWYEPVGCLVTMATSYLIRDIFFKQAKREIRLFEAFVSFKEKGQKSSHVNDVVAMRDVVWNSETRAQQVIPPELIAISPSDAVRSAFSVFGFDCGVPPVIKA